MNSHIISVKEKIGYGMGDAASHIIFDNVMLYMMFFYTDIFGIPAGFVGLFAYLGASLAGWPLAKVLDTWHWSGFFVVIAIAAGISALLLLPFLNAQTPREA